MTHFENNHDGTLLSLVTGCISVLSCLVAQITATTSLPPFIVQGVAVLAGVVSICSGIISIRKNLKNK
jgi:spore maturation protein SpmA